MRFMSMIRIQENTGQVPSEQLMSDMGKLIEEMNAKCASWTGRNSAAHPESNGMPSYQDGEVTW